MSVEVCGSSHLLGLVPVAMAAVKVKLKDYQAKAVTHRHTRLCFFYPLETQKMFVHSRKNQIGVALLGVQPARCCSLFFLSFFLVFFFFSIKSVHAVKGRFQIPPTRNMK